MTFDKVDPKVEFPALERMVLRFWAETDAFEEMRAIHRGDPPWSFLDGPITANNPMGVHHAWGRTYKDVFGRYFAATGHELRYQNGFDCQGLWVEIEVERELGISTKADIERLGLAKFTESCKDRVRKYAAIQTEQSKRLGFWMDWNNSYYTMSDENNYTIWCFLKKCHELGYLYKGTDVMPWSGRAGCAYSHMEIAEGRKLTVHTAVFVRLPIRGRENEYLLVWTTTPWTLTSNTGCAVNGGLTYLRVRARRDGAVYYFAKDNLQFHRQEKEFKEGFGLGPWPDGVPKLKSIHQIFNEMGGYDIEGELPGDDLVGLAYDGPFDELPAQQHKGGFARPMDIIPPEQRNWRSGRDGHRVFDPGSNAKGEPYVVAGEGTGIVHSAPGCGDVDHLWGTQQELVAIAPLDEDSRFIDGFGALTGKRATDPDTVEFILKDLRDKGLLFAAEPYPHVYPHCWRTGDELVFRLVSEWYISMDWRDEIKAVAEQVNWLPPQMYGLERELDWLSTMKDWMISKKRYWGLALPIWECQSCGHFDVIGSKDELRERAIEGWERFEGHSPHRPYVDEVRIRCGQCGAAATRVPDVGNPWLDAGIVAYSTTHYNTDRDHWEKWIPADLITECFPGQFRNWFYAILAMSTMMEMGKPKRRIPFKTVLGHAMVMNEDRQAMHKSDGTAIWFEEAAEQIGVDVMRWMYCRQTPTVDLPFGTRHPDEPVTVDCGDGVLVDQTVGGEPLCRVTSGPADETRRRVLLPLWNTYAFFCNYARLDRFDPLGPQVPLTERQDIDRWILSDVQLLIRNVRRHFESYDLPPVTQHIERFIENLSTWYIRRNRRRFWRGASEDDRDKLAAYQTLYEVLTVLIRVAGPIVPFITEHMYRNLVARWGSGNPQSVHHCPYPEVDEARVDRTLSMEMSALLRIVTMARSARKESKLKVRQPLAEIRIVSESDTERAAVDRFSEHISDELNVKAVTLYAERDDLVMVHVEPSMKTLGPKFGRQTSAVQEAIRALNGREVEGTLARGENPLVSLNGCPTPLESQDLTLVHTFAEGWTGTVDGGTTVLLDTRITPELKNEGIARDIVRNVQNLRKDTGLDIADRIRLSLVTESPAVSSAIEQCRAYIAAETLATVIESTPHENTRQQTHVRIDGETLTIALAETS